MKRITAVAAVAAVFVTGVLAGLAGGHLFYVRRLMHADGPPRFAGERFSRHLERELELTPDQREAVREILRRSHDRAGQLRRETLPRVRSIMEEATAEIEATLTPAQRERFRELRRRQRYRAEQYLLGPPAHRHRGPPHHRPPPP